MKRIFIFLILSIFIQSAWSKPMKGAHRQKQNKNKIENVAVVETQVPAVGLGGIVVPAHTAKQAYLIDLSTHTVLWQKDADIPVPPSSMTKIAAVYVAFDHLKKGRIKMTDMVTISPKAWKTEGSRMFVDVGTQVSVQDLLRGTIVVSGNDATVALAEHIGGSEPAFAEMMTAQARSIGAQHCNFFNSTGLPAEGHVASLKDLAIIGERTILDFPEYYPMYAEQEYSHNNITQPNRNPLLKHFGGCDGLKTGFTDAGGYGLVASAVQKGRRLLLVINGTPSMKARAADAEMLMTWGFQSFASPVLMRPGQVVEEAPVWLGSKDSVPLMAHQAVAVTVPRTQLYNTKVDVQYASPIPAPIKKGQKVGVILITVPGEAPRTYDLVAGSDVERANVFSRIGAAFNHLIFGSSAAQ